MYKDCLILSEPLDLPYSIYTNECLDWLYNLYISEYKISSILYNGKRVIMREEPPQAGKDESFMHLICGANCKDVHEERARRLLWAKNIIQNAPCTYTCSCDKILIWEKNNRIKLFLKKYSYLVILEEKKDLLLFVTGYCVSGYNRKRDLTKEFHECKKRFTSNV